MKKTIFIGLFLWMFSGCYTQFSTLDEPRQPPLSKVTYEIDSATGDTVKVVSQTDTIVKREHETCYWTRNLWGEPELRCDNSYYSQDWYLYNDYPWWYHNSPYMYDAYGRCPQNYYYDESCRSCRYYTDRNNYYGSGYGSRGVGSSSSNVSGKAISRRTRSSGIPNPSGTSSSLNKQQGTTSGSGTNTTQQSGRRMRTRSSEVPVESNSSQSSPASSYVPSASQAKTEVSPPSTPPAQPSNETGQINQQNNPPPASSPPPSNSNQDGGQPERSHRNPRSW